MARQYTFKTTIETTWLDPILEEMTAKQRSAFIRDAIVAYVAQRNTQMSHNVTQRVLAPTEKLIDARYSPEHRPDFSDDAPEIATKQVSIEDLENQLDSLDFM